MKLLLTLLMVAMFPLKNAWAVTDILADISSAANTYTEKLIDIQDKIVELKSNEQLQQVADGVKKAQLMAAKAKKLASDVKKAAEDAQAAIENIKDLSSNVCGALNEINVEGLKSIEDARNRLKERSEEASATYDASETPTLSGGEDTKENQENSSDTQNMLEKQLSSAITTGVTKGDVDFGLPALTDKDNLANIKNIKTPKGAERASMFSRNRNLDNGADNVKDISPEMEQKISKEALQSLTQITDFTPITLPDKNVSFTNSAVPVFPNKAQLEK